MSRRTVLLDMRPSVWLLLFATLATLARSFPAPQEDEDSSGPLPFLQFTKGGIRVNFGGYHAQAGLGGLLTGRRADGGLHASAGTPDGAHASAGLGGSLSDGPLGGLHARAGLGNGGPEAEAGLGGTLAGPRPRGEIYANSSPGTGFVASDKTNYIEKTDGVGKNIQVIVRPKKSSEQEASATADATANVNSGVPVTSLKRQLQLERRLRKIQRRQEKRDRKEQQRLNHSPQVYLYEPLPQQMIPSPELQQPVA